MARSKQLVVDSAKPSALARFWAAALDDFEIRAYDEAEIARLASLGRTPETEPCVILDGPGLEIVAAVLRGRRAADFLDDVERRDDQELMARLTGNYKRGNERLARQHPRRRGTT